MCGRFTLTIPAAEWAALFDVPIPDVEPRYNIAPSQEIAAVRTPPGEVPPRELAWLEWGLVPRWAREPIGRPINARSETVAVKPTFRDSFRDRRCLVVADGFYEWQKQGRFKQPYWIRLADERCFAFAALWDRWMRPGEQPLETCTILTTEANERLRPLHDRMPVILGPDEHEDWLRADTASDRLRELMRPIPSDRIKYQAVSTRVNRPEHDDATCIEPVEGQADLFG